MQVYFESNANLGVEIINLLGCENKLRAILASLRDDADQETRRKNYERKARISSLARDEHARFAFTWELR